MGTEKIIGGEGEFFCLSGRGEKYAVLAIAALALLLRLAVLAVSDNGLLGDPWVRTRLAQEWMRSGGFVSDVTAPLHIWILGLCLKVWNYPLIVPRLVSLFFGMAFLLPFYLLIKRMFSRDIALISGLLVAIYPLHVQNSVLSTAEVSFAFFFFCALLFAHYFVHAKEGKWPMVILTALSLNAACGLRYEGWLLIPLLTYFFFRKSKSYAFLFLCLSMAFPVYWLIECLRNTGNLFPFVEEAAKVNKEHFLAFGLTSLKYRLTAWFMLLSSTITPLIAISGAAGILYSVFIGRERLFLSGIFAVFFIFFSVSCARMTLYAYPPYSIILSLMLIPFGVFFWAKSLCFIQDQASANIPRVRASASSGGDGGTFSCGGKASLVRSVFMRGGRYAVLSLLILTVAVAFGKLIVSQMRSLRINPDTREVAIWLKSHARDTDNILLDWDYSFGMCMPVVSGLRNFIWVPLSFNGDMRELDEKEMNNILFIKKPCFIVAYMNNDGYVKSGEAGKLLDYFGLDAGSPLQQRSGIMFKEVFANSEYRVYEIDYRG